MRKYYGEACEAIFEEVMLEYKAGLISEAEYKKYEKLCFVQEGEPGYEETPAKQKQSAPAL